MYFTPFVCLLALCLVLKRHTNILTPVPLHAIIRLYLPLFSSFTLLVALHYLSLLSLCVSVRMSVSLYDVCAHGVRVEGNAYACAWAHPNTQTAWIVYILSLQSTRKLILWFEMRQNEPFLWHYAKYFLSLSHTVRAYEHILIRCVSCQRQHKHKHM